MYPAGQSHPQRHAAVIGAEWAFADSLMPACNPRDLIERAVRLCRERGDGARTEELKARLDALTKP